MVSLPDSVALGHLDVLEFLAFDFCTRTVLGSLPEWDKMTGLEQRIALQCIHPLVYMPASFFSALELLFGSVGRVRRANNDQGTPTHQQWLVFHPSMSSPFMSEPGIVKYVVDFDYRYDINFDDLEGIYVHLYEPISKIISESSTRLRKLWAKSETRRICTC